MSGSRDKWEFLYLFLNFAVNLKVFFKKVLIKKKKNEKRKNEAPILYLLWRTDSLEKTTDSGKYWRQEEKGTIKDEMVDRHHQLNGHEFEQALAVDGQGNLACCGPWGHKESDTTEWLNWTELNPFMSSSVILFFVKIFTIMPKSLSLFYMLLFHL